MENPREPDRVIRLAHEDAPDVVAVFCDAFVDYPVMRFVLADAGPDYATRLETLIRFFVMARSLRNEPMLGIVEGDRLVAAATMSFPGGADSPPAVAELREHTWEVLGGEARARYETCGAAWAPLQVGDPHTHLNMIGVRASARGKGLATILLDAAQRVSRETPGSTGVSLTTEDPRNVAVYEHCGYEVVGRARVSPELETWGMFRRN